MPATRFDRLAAHASTASGKSYVFFVALLLVLLWAGSGPFLDFSDVWQLSINTTTTIVTFLMVFLLQNAQARDTKAMQHKLDELIRIHRKADNHLIGEERIDKEL